MVELGDGRFSSQGLFFLALCHQRLGDPARAKDHFDRTVRRRQEHKDLSAQHVDELKEFQAEAEASLKTMPPGGRK